MKAILPSALLLFTVLGGSLAAADAPQVIVSDRWPGKIASVWNIGDKGQEHESGLLEGDARDAWDDVDAAIATELKITGRKAIVSPEYIAYRMGFWALIAPASYSNDPKTFPPYVNAGTAAHPWIALVQPGASLDHLNGKIMDDAHVSAEENCMALSRLQGQDGPVTGCGDVWQNGIAPQALACLNGQTYVRCHLDCREKVMQVKLGYTPGACVRPR